MYSYGVLVAGTNVIVFSERHICNFCLVLHWKYIEMIFENPIGVLDSNHINIISIGMLSFLFIL